MSAIRRAAHCCALAGALALGLASLAGAQSAPVPPAVEQAAHGYITRAALEAPIRFLSSDLLEGRGPATRADQLARLYLQTRLEGMGLQPAFAGGEWQQPFDIVGIKSAFPVTWSFEGKSGRVDLAWRADYIAASGLQTDKVALSDAELVFVGYGIQAPEYQWDDFKGADLAGKILVVMNNDPDWDPHLFAGKRRLYYGRWDYKYESAARQGAAGAIIIHTTPSAGYPWQVVQSSWGGEQFALPAGDEPHLHVKAWATEDAVRRLVRAGGLDLEQLLRAARSRAFKPVPLGVRTSLSIHQHAVARADRQRRRRAAGERSAARGAARGAVGPPRSLRHRRAGRRRRSHLSRCRRQRFGLRAGARHRARARGAAAAAAPLGTGAVRRRRGARAARLDVLRRAPIGARRADRGGHQHRRR